MSKKRKKLWIVGGVLGFVVLYSATAFLVSWNSPDARLERALQSIIAEQGFEHFDSKTALGPEVKLVTRTNYEGEPINQEYEKRILDQFREACPSCTVQTYSLTGETYDIYRLTPQDTTDIVYILLVLDDEGYTNEFTNEGDSSISVLVVARYTDAHPWSFIKNLWPW